MQVSEAQAVLAERLHQGQEVTTTVLDVSRNGMARTILALVVDETGRIINLSWFVAKACGLRYDDRRNGVRMHGVGEDMGHSLVYTVSLMLYGNGYKLEHRRV